MITVEKLVKRFAGRTVLDGIGLEVGAGEVVCLVGPSGGGKTTLLRCLNGLERFEEGSVTIDDVRLDGARTRANDTALSAIRQRAGFVFQQWNLFAHRSVVGNVIEAPVMVRREDPAKATARAEALLAKVGLSHRVGAYPHELSGGEQQRVAIARALAMNPRVLLMDEPTSALDPERVGDVVALLGALRADGLTLVIVTHEMGFVRAIADRVVVLHGGKILEQGTPASVLDAPQEARTRAFLGRRA